jgi:charged multivesicular body protein 2A
MGNSFTSEKKLKETIRENQRLLKKSIREIEKELTNLKKQEQKLEIDIKKTVKFNQMVIFIKFDSTIK